MSEKEAIKLLNKLRRLPENKNCAACREVCENPMGFPSVCVKFKTFVCSKCKSAHQSFSHRVKHYSMSTFTLAEVEGFKDENGGGNAYARRTYFAKLREESSAWPCDGDTLDIYKDFIKKAYIDLYWMKSDGSPKKEKKKKKKEKKRKKDRKNSFSNNESAVFSGGDTDFFNEIAAANTDVQGDLFSGGGGNVDDVPPASLSGDDDNFFGTSNNNNDSWGDGGGSVSSNSNGFDLFASSSNDNNTSFDVFANAATGQNASESNNSVTVFGNFGSSSNGNSNVNANNDSFVASFDNTGKKSKSSKKKKKKSKNKNLNSPTDDDLLGFGDNDNDKTVGGIDDLMSGALGTFSSNGRGNTSKTDDILGMFGSSITNNTTGGGRNDNNDSNCQPDLLSGFSTATTTIGSNGLSMSNNNNNTMASSMNSGSTYDPFAMLTNTGAVKRVQQQMPRAPLFNQGPPNMGHGLNLNGMRRNPMSSMPRAMNNNGIMGMNVMPSSSGIRNNTSMSGMSSMSGMTPMKPMKHGNTSNSNQKKITTAKHDPFANLTGI